ncbi:MAG: cupin domain-containing protein [Bacteroidota bacterium]
MDSLKGKSFTNPLNKDTITFIETIKETNNKRSVIDIVLFPGGGVPMHYHTDFEESFEVIEGELMVQVGKEKIKLTAGESITAKIGVPHRFYSEFDEPTTFRGIVSPGHEGFEYFLPILYGLSSDGLVNKNSTPKSFRHLAIMTTMAGTRFVGPLSLLEKVFARIAKTKKSKQIQADLIEKYCR